MDESLIDQIVSADPTLTSTTAFNTVQSSGNSAIFTNDQPVQGSSTGIGGIIASLGADVLGIIGITKGNGTVNTGTATYVPTSTSVTSSLSKSMLVLGGVAIVAAIVFLHH